MSGGICRRPIPGRGRPWRCVVCRRYVRRHRGIWSWRWLT